MWISKTVELAKYHVSICWLYSLHYILPSFYYYSLLHREFSFSLYFFIYHPYMLIKLLFFYLSQYLTNLMHKICFTIIFISCLYMFRTHVLIIRRSKLHYTAYRCDETRGCVMQFWPPDDEHMCSKHVEVWNKLIVKRKFCASSWLFTEINILRCSTVSKTSKCIFLILWT